MGDSLIFVPRQNGKIFLKTGETEREWKEVGFVNETLICDESDSESIRKISMKVRLSFKFTLKPRKVAIALAQMCGVAKSPRCTYKTIKRNCAKRNR